MLTNKNSVLSKSKNDDASGKSSVVGKRNDNVLSKSSVVGKKNDNTLSKSSVVDKKNDNTLSKSSVVGKKCEERRRHEQEQRRREEQVPQTGVSFSWGQRRYTLPSSGSLASVLAKELLNGQHVVCVRAEDINISGSLYRNKLKYANFRRKHMNSNPKQGPLHYRSPSKILWRTIRGMVPHKTARGSAALDRLKTFEGIPHPYDRKKRMVVPSCLKVLRLRPERRFCRLGDLSQQVGWKHGALIERLESQRKVKSSAFYKKKTATLRAKNEAKKAVKLSADQMKPLMRWLALLGLFEAEAQAPARLAVFDACDDAVNTEYDLQGTTGSGAPFYKAVESDLHIYFDPSCDGSTGDSRWIIDRLDGTPDRNATEDLD
ncbi:unnamed protein product, partial [Effrenium voratum]